MFWCGTTWLLLHARGPGVGRQPLELGVGLVPWTGRPSCQHCRASPGPAQSCAPRAPLRSSALISGHVCPGRGLVEEVWGRPSAAALQVVQATCLTFSELWVCWAGSHGFVAQRRYWDRILGWLGVGAGLGGSPGSGRRTRPQAGAGPRARQVPGSPWGLGRPFSVGAGSPRRGQLLLTQGCPFSVASFCP